MVRVLAMAQARVSIHAPRAERDSVVWFQIVPALRVSIHAPRAERDFVT